MNKLLQVDFKHSGPFGQAMSDALEELAKTINQEPGFIWKIWTESEKTGEAGGVYIFKSEETALNYLDKHTTRLKKMGISEVRGKIYDINEPLSIINKGPVN